MAITAGYDVGGAHLKVALTEGGRILAAVQIACPLWLGIDRLDNAFRQAGPLTSRARRHAATMTGELCELFPDRPTGVRTLIDRLVKLVGPDTRIWMGPCGFGSAQEARQDPATVASTNFLASAELVAQLLGDGLLVDMGSTTTDIIPVASGMPCPRGLTDGDRLATSELVYTGLTRTDVAAVAHDVMFKKRRQRLAAGAFATMADVRRVLGELPESTDQHTTSDRRGTSLPESVARLARAFGRDAGDASLDDWRESARAIADRQMAELRAACADVLATSPVPAGAPIVAAGIGAPLLAALAAEVGRPCQPFADLVDAVPDARVWVTRCAPAVAVAILADASDTKAPS
jgi:(4-(4-[2-(gamma-L-glutamylamino)ethyl]phenoxymethyl)furan-2-yl)methanamine synthase